MGYHTMCIKELSWQQEYELFCNSEQIKEESFKGWYSVEGEIKRCNKISRKRKKHVKDKKGYYMSLIMQGLVPVHQGRTECSWELSFKYHKHKRAEKVFTQEESGQYFDYLAWYDHDGYDYSDLYAIPECDLEEYDWYCYELVHPQYASDFNWKEECSLECYSQNGNTYSADSLLFCRNTVLPSWHKEVCDTVKFFDQFK